MTLFLASGPTNGPWPPANHMLKGIRHRANFLLELSFPNSGTFSYKTIFRGEKYLAEVLSSFWEQYLNEPFSQLVGSTLIFSCIFCCQDRFGRGAHLPPPHHPQLGRQLSHLPVLVTKSIKKLQPYFCKREK